MSQLTVSRTFDKLRDDDIIPHTFHAKILKHVDIVTNRRANKVTSNNKLNIKLVSIVIVKFVMVVVFRGPVVLRLILRDFCLPLSIAQPWTARYTIGPK